MPSDEKTFQAPPNKNDGLLFYVLLAFWIAIIANNYLAAQQVETLPYSTFLSYAQAGKLEDITIGAQELTGSLKDVEATPAEKVQQDRTSRKQSQKKKFRCVRVDDMQLASRLAGQGVKFQGVLEDPFWKAIFGWVLPALVLLGVWSFFTTRMMGKNGMDMGMGQNLLSIEKSKARTYMESNIRVTFKDVAGVDEAKEELQEVIGFLKEPQRYNRLGGHLPKGILLVGPPGTGKTLLARAVAGEAGVPFFSISGSEFVELFVGVGAARVRDLFEQAQKNAPCIIFIDELDALGRARGASAQMGGHDEKEQTLNQLLVEMDGFDPRQGVVLLAATNRPEILDNALLRAGRFDRHILVDRPDRQGRVQILKVHLVNVSCDETVDADKIAASTPGFTGADLANLVNEAALLATRRNAGSVQADDFNAALERAVAGLEKKNRLLNARERKVVAHHEMGHALVSMSLPGMDPIQKISIIPRGISALGYTMQRPTEDRFLMSQTELENKLAVLLGGRAAEQIIFGDISTGAADDLNKATDIARSMAVRYGMVPSLGPVTYEEESGLEHRRVSEDTAQAIDRAVRQLISDAFEKAQNILHEHRRELENGAALLLAKESLSPEDLKDLQDKKDKTEQSDLSKLQQAVSSGNA